MNLGTLEAAIASRSPVRFVALMLLISGAFYYLSIAGAAAVNAPVFPSSSGVALLVS